MTQDNGGPAFPHMPKFGSLDGMTLRDYFAGQALTNPSICTGVAPDWQLQIWFGDRGGITAEEIAAKQAMSYADAMLEARK